MTSEENTTAIRRSSRATRGINTRLTYEQELELDTLKSKKRTVAPAKKSGSDTKKQKTQPAPAPAPRSAPLAEEPEDEVEDGEDEPAQLDDSDEEFVGSDHEAVEDDNLEESVRCLVCGATDENYDEDSDTLGLMVECGKCQTWQHAKCVLGHKNPKKIPEDYVCNVCEPDRYPNLKLKTSVAQYNKAKKIRKKPTLDSKLSFNKIRLSVAQTFHKLFSELLAHISVIEGDEEIKALAQKHAMELEEAIFRNYSTISNKNPTSPGQKYSEKSRSLYANLKDKKNVLYSQVCEGKLTMDHLSLMSPQELLNPDLQKFSKQVMKQAIQDSVLKPIMKPTFRKTHKGDEAVEDEESNDVEISSNVGLVFNKPRSESTSTKLETGEDEEAMTSTQPTDIEDGSNDKQLDSAGHRTSLINTSVPIEPEENEITGSPARDYENVGLDDDLDDILNDKSNFEPKSASGSPQTASSTPPHLAIDDDLWKGELTFPGICNFESRMKFVATTNNKPALKEAETTAKLMDSFEIKNYLEIEGRLSADKAVAYLNKILKSRYLTICKLEAVSDNSNFQRLFQYFHLRKKIGVIGNRPTFVKDCYLLTFDKRFIQDIKQSNLSDQDLDTLFNSFKQDVFKDLSIEDTILAVFVVKPNFVASIKSSSSAAPRPTANLSLKTLPADFYRLSSQNQQKFMEIIQLSDQKGKILTEQEIENLVKNLL